MPISVDLTGRRVLLTGASSGIGEATCRAIVEYGGSVAMLARRQERLDKLREELGDRVVPIVCDVTDLDALERACRQAAEALGGLDTLIAVAGRATVGTITTGDPEKWRDIFELNLLSPLAAVRFGLPYFAEDGRRDVVIVGSAASITARAGVAIYGASKRGLKAAFESLRLELAPTGINTSLVVPGAFATEGLSMEGILFNGDPAPGEPQFTPGGGPFSPMALADAIAFMIGQPDGVCINELVMRPTANLQP